MLATEAPSLVMVVLLPFGLLVLVCGIVCALYVALGRVSPPKHR